MRMNVVITGGLGVLGLGCAHAFLNAGARVVLADIQQKPELLHALTLEYGQRLRFLSCDVSQLSECTQLVQNSEAFFNAAIDVFLVNAGVPFGGEFLKASQEQIQRVVDVNILGSIYSAQAAIPSLLKNRTPC